MAGETQLVRADASERRVLQLGEAIRIARKCHASGDSAAAEDLYRQILSSRPEAPGVEGYLALLLIETGRAAEALPLIEAAIVREPENPELALGRADALAMLGHTVEAARGYQAILLGNPRAPRAAANFARAAARAGAGGDAAAAYRLALDLLPESAALHLELGDLLVAGNVLEEAAGHYQQAATLARGLPVALAALGWALIESGRSRQAIEPLRRALSIEPLRLQTHQDLVRALMRAHRFAEAADAALEMLRLWPGLDDAHAAVESCIYQLAGAVDQETIIGLVRRWLETEPDLTRHRHRILAVSGAPPPARADDGHLRAVFDEFSSFFDERMDELGYRAPALLHAALLARLGSGRSGLRVLDAGCGTGLAAPLLRPLANRLVGIDLSAGMLEKAQARELYDRIEACELHQWIETTGERFDIVFSADVIIYVGALERFFAGARRILAPGGLLALSFERAGDPGARFVLEGSGRYSHTPGYIRESLLSAGLEADRLEDATLRRELGNDVPGLILLARRP